MSQETSTSALSEPSRPTSRLRVGMIGLGKAGCIHLSNLAAISDVQIVAVADKRGGQDGEMPQETAVFQDWEQLLHEADVDAVVISLPHSMHAECAEAALRRGIHVFIEKPIATNIEDARNLVSCAKAAGCRLLVNMTHRFYPPLQHAKAMLRDGVIGDLISVRDYYMESIVREDFPAWFFDPVMAGGGVVMTDSIHLLDRVSWLLDEPLRFVGGSSRYLHPESEVEDCAEILCASCSGIPVTIGSFFFTGPRMWEDGLTLFGTKGTMHVQAWSHVEWRLYGGPAQRMEGYAETDIEARPRIGHRAAIEEFVKAIREGGESEIDGARILNALEIVEEFYRFTATKDIKHELH